VEGVVENSQTGTTQKFPAGMGLTLWTASPDIARTLQFLHSALSDGKSQSADLTNIFSRNPRETSKISKKNHAFEKSHAFQKKKKRHFEVFFFLSVAIEIKIT